MHQIQNMPHKRFLLSSVLQTILLLYKIVSFEMLLPFLKLSPEANLNENESTSLRYFTRPSIDNLKSFFEFPPHQPHADVPFNTQRAYFRLDANGQKVQQQWLTYALEE